ncbi:unnamed protein product [Prunus armeniaca]
MFVIAPSGPFWREMRKITTLELLSNRRLELLRRIRVSEVTTFLQELYKTWSTAEKRETNNSDGVLVELKQWFGDMTLNVILRMVA